jgi:hypothetical protein
LDFNNVVFLLSKIEEFHLGGGNNSNNRAVFFDSVEGNFNGFLFFGVFLLIFGESLLFGAGPVFVESSKGIFIKFLGPNSGKSSKSSGGFDVSDNSDNNHRGAFNHGNSFNNFFFVVFGSGSFNISENMGHTSFESSESSQMTRSASIIFRE